MTALHDTITQIARAPLDLRITDGDRRRPEGAAMRREIALLRVVEWEIEQAGHPDIAANVRAVIDRLVAEVRS